MKLGGDISMRSRMTNVEGQRGLIEIAAADPIPAASRDSDCRPSAPTTSRADSDRPRRRYGARRSILFRSRSPVTSSSNRVKLANLVARCRARPSAPDSRYYSRTGSRPISWDENFTSGPDQPPGIVDQPHRLQWHGLVPRNAARPRAAPGNRWFAPSRAVVRLSA